VFGRWPVSLGLWLAMALGTCAAAAAALAEPNVVDVGASPIIRVVAGQGTITIRTWDRSAVQVEDPSGDAEVRQFEVNSSEAQSVIPVFAGRVPGASGILELPPESFAVSTVPEGPRPVVSVRTHDTDLTVTVPKTASLVTVQLNKGNVDIHDYRGGTFVARVRGGSVHLDNVGGDGFVQVMRGPVIARGSSFDRLRVRTGSGNVVFDGCHSKQIEVSSVNGSIVYDGGSFEPGLAHFETQNGNVAVGVAGAASLDGHSSTGHTYAAFDKPAQVTDGAQHVTVGSGGPLVSATSSSGNVYFYDGYLHTHRTPAEWQPVRQTMHRVMGARPVAGGAPEPGAPPSPRRRRHPKPAPAPSPAP
jgi:Toastrack DUF4097